jgi:bacteriocin biosynthesis cyclodehydratase domain-containing protein
MLVETPVDAPWHDDSAQSRFYVNFGVQPGQVMDRLRAARVDIYGRNGISRVLAASLLDMHIGRVTLVDDPTLADPEAGREWPDRTLAPFDGHDGVRDSAVADARLTVLEGAGPVNVADTTVLCATSDFGMSQRLLDINQAALEGRTPFLPVWLQDLVGYVGPLVYPFDTACLRCYRLRVDANDERYEITNAVREHMATHLEARPGTGFLPAMTGALGYVAAVEIVKSVSGFAPADAIGRSIELNLVSFGSTVRRVLKVPRCPACSPVMQRTTRVLTTGPQIPHRT